MIVDTSAIIAILRGEPEAESFIGKIQTAGDAKISAGSWVELGAVLTGFGEATLEPKLLALVRALRISIAPIGAEQAETGRQAYREYGKGQHRARLNFCDCFAYALAKSTGEPLLFKGDDFIHTDIRAA